MPDTFSVPHVAASFAASRRIACLSWACELRRVVVV
jgi:hypothetical protein